MKLDLLDDSTCTWLTEAERCIHASVTWAIIGSHTGLSPNRRQAIIWNNAGLLLIRTLGTNFSETLIKIHTFSLVWIMATILSRPHCVNHNMCFPHINPILLSLYQFLYVISSACHLAAIVEATVLVPSHPCQVTAIQGPVDDIYWHPIFKWIAVTWLNEWVPVS